MDMRRAKIVATLGPASSDQDTIRKMVELGMAVGGRCLALDTASLSVFGHEHEQRVIRWWNESYALVEER